MPLKSFLRNAIEKGKKIEAKNKRKKASTKKASGKKRSSTASLKSAGRATTVGKARQRRDNRLNSIMGEMRKTRGR